MNTNKIKKTAAKVGKTAAWAGAVAIGTPIYMSVSAFIGMCEASMKIQTKYSNKLQKIWMEEPETETN